MGSGSVRLRHREVPVGSPCNGTAADMVRSAVGIVGLAGLVAGLHAAGRPSLPMPSPSLLGWLGEHGALVAGFALLRLVALALAWYVLAAAVVASVVGFGRGPGPVRFVARLVAPGLRTALDRMVGASLCSVLVVPAVTSAASPVRSVPAASAAPVVLVPDVPPLAPEAPPLAPGHAVFGAPRPPGWPEQVSGQWWDAAGASAGHRAAETAVPAKLGLAAAQRATDVHVVVPGDSFWRIAAQVLAVPGQVVGDAEVAAYWRRLVTANRARLADPGNPDLLFPGQQLHLPPRAAR